MKERITPVGRPSLLRHTNALTILGVLRKVGSCSRADLVRATGMSAPTVTNVVDSLLADDALRRRLGDAARAAVAPYTYDAMLAAFDRALASAISPSPTGP